MENHEDLLAFLAKVRNFKNDGPLMTQFANVIKSGDENSQAITSLSTKNDLAHEGLSQSVATVVKRANTIASDVGLLTPEVEALNKQVFNRSFGRATPSPGKADGGDEGKSSGDPNGSHVLKPQPPKPTEGRKRLSSGGAGTPRPAARRARQGAWPLWNPGK